MNIQVELEALHQNLKTQLDVDYYMTEKQMIAIIMLLQEGLSSKKREVRIAVLKAMAEEPMKIRIGPRHKIESTKNLDGFVASEIINLLKDNTDEIRLSTYGKKFLEELEKIVQKELSQRQTVLI